MILEPWLFTYLQPTTAKNNKELLSIRLTRYTEHRNTQKMFHCSQIESERNSRKSLNLE